MVMGSCILVNSAKKKIYKYAVKLYAEAFISDMKTKFVVIRYLKCIWHEIFY